MPKFTFEVDVTGAIEAWEMALAIQDRVNNALHKDRSTFFIEKVAEFHPDEFHPETIFYPETIEDAYERGFEAGEQSTSTSGEWQEGYDEGYKVGLNEHEKSDD